MDIHLKEIYIKKNSRNAILITPDNHKGLVVQVIRFSTQLKPNVNNELVEHRVRYALWTKTISTIDDHMLANLDINPMAPLKPKDGKQFKNEINRTIEEAKSYLSKIEVLDTMINGSMTDYLSQNQEINKDQ